MPTSAAMLCAVMPEVMGAFRAAMRAERPAELSLPQFRALIFLSRRAGASMSAVSEHLGLALSTTSQLLTGLVKRHYITRQTAQGDRRRVTLTLTASGQAMLDALRARAQASMAIRLVDLTPEERATLDSAMQTLQRVFGATTTSDHMRSRSIR